MLTVAFFGYLAWRSIRERSPHWLLIVGIAAFFAGALDPLANWATFAVFDPRVAHFPLSWPYFNVSPLSGADAVVPRRLRELLRADRARPACRFIGDSSNRESATTAGSTGIGFVAVFITGFIAGLPLNALMQFMWLKVGLFVYTEAAGPVLHIGGRQLPLYMVIYDSVLFAIVALLCVRDDNGPPRDRRQGWRSAFRVFRRAESPPRDCSSSRRRC